MANKNIVTASLVVYNCNLEKLYETIDTFLAQEGIMKYLAIIDNASTKRDIIESLRDKYKNNKSVTIANGMLNRGYGGGNNIGFIIAKEYIKNNDLMHLRHFHLILNPDLIITENCLSKMVGYMNQNNDIGLLVPKILNTDGTLQELNKEHPTIFDLFARRFLPGFIAKTSFFEKRHNYYTRKKYGYDKVIDVPFASGCFMLFDANKYEQIGGFDESYFLYMEDADISRRMHNISKVIFYPDSVVKHYWERATHGNWRMTFIAIKSAIIYFRKHGLKLW